jgi:hypothetical protein
LIDVANSCTRSSSPSAAAHLRGVPTKAIYVFGTMLRKLLREQQPDAS